MCLNHPQTFPCPQSVEKLSSIKNWSLVLFGTTWGPLIYRHLLLDPTESSKAVCMSRLRSNKPNRIVHNEKTCKQKEPREKLFCKVRSDLI